MLSPKFIFILLMDICFLGNFCESQDLPMDVEFMHYDKTDGLSQQVIRTITQDNSGFIWVGTEGGLNRFDGYDFKQYLFDRNDIHSLPDNFIYTLTPSFDGGLWVGTNSGGLAKYNPVTDNFTCFEHNPFMQFKIATVGILALFEDSNHNLWIGTNFSGLYYLDTKTNNVIHYTHEINNPHSLSADNIFDITADKAGKLWIRTSVGIDNFDTQNHTFTGYKVDGFISSVDYRRSLYLDEKNILWFTSENGLVRFDTKSKKQQMVWFSNYKRDKTSYNSIIPQDENHLWVAGFEGIFLFDKTNYSVIHFSHDEKRAGSIFPGSTINLFKDRTGSLWAASYSSGISKLNLNRKKFIRHNNYEGNAFNPIRSLMIDNQDNIWVGSLTTSVSKISQSAPKNNYEKQNIKNGIIGNPSICCFMNGPDGNIWAGTWGFGIQIINSQTAQTIRFIKGESGGSKSIVQALRTDRFGNVWIGKESGLEIYDPRSGRSKEFFYDKTNVNSILPWGVQSNCIIEDIYHHTWVGTWGGLTEMIPKDVNINSLDVNYDFKRFTHDVKNNNSISDSRIVSLYYDSLLYPDILFAGTYGGGLNRILFKGDVKIKTYARKEGLPDDVIYAMLGDDHHKIWMSTNNALSCFDPENELIKNFNVGDGLQSNQFYWGAAAKGNRGELLFGAINGFILFHPDEIVNDTTLPSVVFTDFKLFNKSVGIGQKVDNHIILNQSINMTDELNLSHHENIFTFEFSGLHYALPKANRYRYKLEGFDKDWVEVDYKKRFVTYTNLSSGTYYFKVKASNYDGVWTVKEKTIRIIIHPPYWQTWWFRLVGIMMIISIFFGFYYLRIARINRKNTELERLVKQRTSEIEEKNTVLFEQTYALNATNTLLEERQQHIEEQAEELMAQTEQLTQLNATKDKLFSILAHDLRNPFNVLIGLSEVLLINKNRLSQEKIEKYLGLIHTSSIKGNDLLENILQWSRTQIGRMSFQPEDMKLAAIVDGVKNLVEAGAQQKNIKINQLIDASYIVIADENMLKTIFRNLISNAIKFTPENGTITMFAKLSPDEGFLEISVSDTGVGIADTMQHNLFYIDNSISTRGTAQETGTGLGLIICKEFVEIHHGKIWYKSDLNVGTTFYITLPYKKS